MSTTFVMTSCGRPDLLKRTLDSFFKVNRFPIDRFIIHEDGMSAGVLELVNERWPFIEVIGSADRVGLHASLDRLFAEVRTPWVFSCEDDWDFFGNRDFIYHSWVLLMEKPDIHQVWIREPQDHRHPLGQLEQCKGIQYQALTKGYKGIWGGLSFNPTLRRMSDIKKLFPEGFKVHAREEEVSIYVDSVGYKAVSLAQSACRHNGNGRHTPNFKP